MNKKLVAVAIAGLLAAPLVHAQTPTANVVLYGRLNVDMEVVTGKRADGTNPSIYRLSSNSSRFGLRGTESLGGGLNAIFQIENGSLGIDASGGTLAGRDTFLGLQGSWGRFVMGRFHAPYDPVSDIFASQPTLVTGILASSALWAQGGRTKQDGTFDDRIANSIRYDSPVMSGFKGAIQYSAGGGPTGLIEGTPKTNSGVTSGAVFYDNGPLKLSAGFQTNNSYRAAGLNDLAWSVSGGWQFPGALVGVIYEKLDYDCSVAVGTNASVACNQITGGVRTNLTRNFWAASTTINVGPGQVYALWARAQDGKGSAPNGARIGGLAKGPDSSSTQWEVSYTHPLSSRTSVYTGYVKLNNSANASYNFGVNGIIPPPGGKPGGFVLGMFHNF